MTVPEVLSVVMGVFMGLVSWIFKTMWAADKKNSDDILALERRTVTSEAHYRDISEIKSMVKDIRDKVYRKD